MTAEILPLRMKRNHDGNGVSGEGWVAVMGVYPSGKTVSEWTVEGKPNSMGVYNTFGDFLAIHVFSHPDNNTEIWSEAWEPIDKPRNFAQVGGLMQHQQDFEKTRVATDGTLNDFNTPEHALVRGIMGEAQECLDEVQKGDLEAAQMEACDVLIFIATLFNHLHLTPDEVQAITFKKMQRNYRKYAAENFEGVTIAEGLSISRERWQSDHSPQPEVV